MQVLKFSPVYWGFGVENPQRRVRNDRFGSICPSQSSIRFFDQPIERRSQALSERKLIEKMKVGEDQEILRRANRRLSQETVLENDSKGPKNRKEAEKIAVYRPTAASDRAEGRG
jgi:hypothetical protein